MSNPFTTKQIQDQYASLPADMQAVIASSDTASLIQSIGAKHELRIDAVGSLIEYSGLMMLGLIDSDEFVNALAREVGTTREQAANLALDVDTQVFSRVRNSLRQTQYKATADTRFETKDDFSTPVPQAEPAVPEPEIASESVGNAAAFDQPISSDIPMAAGDYNPSDFAATPLAQPGSNKQEDAPAYDLPDQPEKGLNGEFVVTPNQAQGSIEVEINKNPAVQQVDAGFNSAVVEQEVSRSIAQEVVKGMPQAVQDAYKAGQAAAPAPQVGTTVIKDFQTRLEEKIANSNTAVQNSDPYKESI